MLTGSGERALKSFGVTLEEAQMFGRRFAYACLDWSERQPHIGGWLGFALLALGIDKNWWVRDVNSRALHLTRIGQRELQEQFGLSVAILRSKQVYDLPA